MNLPSFGFIFVMLRDVSIILTQTQPVDFIKPAFSLLSADGVNQLPYEEQNPSTCEMQLRTIAFLNPC